MAKEHKKAVSEKAAAETDAELESLKNWGAPSQSVQQKGATDTSVDCGWGRLVFGQTFADPARLAEVLQEEGPRQRDIAFYVRETHLVLASAPQALFLDPSHTFRLGLLEADIGDLETEGMHIRPAVPEDEQAINTIYASRDMITPGTEFFQTVAERDDLIIFVAEEGKTNTVVGVVMGVDHVAAFNDADNGSSLWALAVDTRARYPGIGKILSLALASHFKGLGRTFMDLSVMHDNNDAIGLYQKLGFERVPVFCVKKKNTVNEKLFVGPEPDYDLNIYAQIIVDEARRRGITVEIEDAAAGLFRLTHGARTIACRESLSELTSAVAMSRCDDKALTHRLLKAVGLKVPAQEAYVDDEQALAFLERYGRVVVKPTRGEQGQGVFVDLQSARGLKKALHEARKLSDQVILEQFVLGHDVRVIVIDGQVVAAATRKPATVIGDGKCTVKKLIEKQSRRRAAATGGESQIPIDDETERCLRHAGCTLDTVLEDGEVLAVRKTANLHTGGTIHDVTEELHPSLADAAQRAAEALSMPLVGLDLMVPAVDQPAYWIIEANERPGLANHEPAPTAEKFLDLLFPETRHTI